MEPLFMAKFSISAFYVGIFTYEVATSNIYALSSLWAYFSVFTFELNLKNLFCFVRSQIFQSQWTY